MNLKAKSEQRQRETVQNGKRVAQQRWAFTKVTGNNDQSPCRLQAIMSAGRLFTNEHVASNNELKIPEITQ